jgi:ADP-ribosylglycohydrolase/alpha/beta superfamily hydrolase
MNRAPAVVQASLFGDALSLGAHWLYNPDQIRRLFPGGLERYADPASQYHAGRVAGDLTHYGEQTVALLHSLALRGEAWSEAGWREDWTRFWQTASCYRDSATKQTLANAAQGDLTPSASDDLAGASRIAPVLAAMAQRPLADRIAAARAQTRLTHGDPGVGDAAEFFARTVDALWAGKSLSQAFEEAASVEYAALAASSELARARQAASIWSSSGDQAAGGFGLTCHLSDAFPLTLALALAYEHAAVPVEALVRNVMLGGDSAARGLLLGLLFGARDGLSGFPYAWLDELRSRERVEALLTLLVPAAGTVTTAVSFPNPLGDALHAVIDFPEGPPRAFAIFAHCFTCGKNLRAASRIARSLAEEGIATLRFDFTGLGASGGDFAETSFLTNLDDLAAAAGFLRERYRAPSILIGHSLGGAAVLAAAQRIPEVRGVATIGAPADPGHVTHLFGDDLEAIRRDGRAVVTLAGRRFTIGAKFLEELETHCQPCAIGNLQRDLLVLHAPADETVGVENARMIFEAAKHPKSFHALAGADHLLTRPDDADYAAVLIAAWARRLRPDLTVR